MGVWRLLRGLLVRLRLGFISLRWFGLRLCIIHELWV
jgi:hypothetical protein